MNSNLYAEPWPGSSKKSINQRGAKKSVNAYPHFWVKQSHLLSNVNKKSLELLKYFSCV